MSIYELSHKNPAKRLFLNSKACDIRVSRGDMYFIFRQPIHVSLTIQIYFTLSELTIPNSLYNVNAYNNGIRLVKNSIVYTYTTPVSNYTPSTLITVLTSLMSGDGFTITYSSLTSFFTMTHLSLDFVLNSNSTAYSVLGFDYLLGDKSSTSKSLSSDRQIDLSGYCSFYFTTQLPSENTNFMQVGTG